MLCTYCERAVGECQRAELWRCSCLAKSGSAVVSWFCGVSYWRVVTRQVDLIAR